MITTTETSNATDPGLQRQGGRAETANWQKALKEAVRDPDELKQLLSLHDDWAPDSWHDEERQGAGAFGLFVPRSFVARMRPGDPNDPLLRQVLPLADERLQVSGFVTDPVGDLEAARGPGLLHKYQGRVLLITTGACAVHCRYCFRRHFPYSDAPKSPPQWREAVQQIAADSTIDEVILSGGDPLMLTDTVLAELVGMLEPTPHLRRLRIHTRLPIMIPERVTSELLQWLTGTQLTPIMVIHSNHAAELDDNVARAISKLSSAGVMLLNQAVLLRGVNDSLSALEDLSRRLIDLRVAPYYLHQLDPVAGAAHFFVPVERGLELVEQLRQRLPGYAVPRYVQETAGAASKVPLD
jgi:L-lysine 2,3-aminomutase